MVSRLSQAFDAALPSELRSNADFTPTLASLVATARQAWPSLDFDDAASVMHLGATRRPGETLTESLAGLHVADLCLAWSAARQSELAMREVEARCFPDLDHAWRRYAYLGRDLDDVRQILRTRLFLGEDGHAPKLLDYRGKGTLRSWMRVVITNLLANVFRRDAKEVPIDDALLLALPDRGDAAEVAHLKDVYREEFRAAFVRAASELTSREKNMLRYAFAENLSIDQIAAIYNVHRTTAGRWLTSAQESLVAAIRKDLTQRLNVSDDELQSALRGVMSQVQITLARYLRVRT